MEGRTTWALRKRAGALRFKGEGHALRRWFETEHVTPPAQPHSRNTPKEVCMSRARILRATLVCAAVAWLGAACQDDLVEPASSPAPRSPSNGTGLGSIS